MNVIDLTCARGRLVALVDTLECSSQDSLAGPNDVDRLTQQVWGDPGDLVNPLWGISLDDPLELFDSNSMFLDVVLVDVSSFKHQPLHTVEQGQVSTRGWLQVNGSQFGGRGPSRINDDASRWVGTVQTIEHTGPKDGLSGSDVVADDEETVGHVDVGVRTGLAVTSERLSL